MPLKDLNSSLVGKIVIIVSIILVILCVYMISTPSETTGVGQDTYHTENVEWNGMHFAVLADSEYSMTDDSLIVTSKYDKHNIELTKTKDQSTFNDKMGDITSFAYYPRDSEHMVFESLNEPYAVIIDNDDFNNRTLKIEEGTEFIEVIAHDKAYLTSFIVGSGEF